MIWRCDTDKLKRKKPSAEADRRSIFMGLYDERNKSKTR